MAELDVEQCFQVALNAVREGGQVYQVVILIIIFNYLSLLFIKAYYGRIFKKEICYC